MYELMDAAFMLLVVMLLVSGIVFVTTGVTLGSVPRSVTRHAHHLAAYIACIPLAALAMLFFASIPTSLATYAKSSGPHALIVGPWHVFLYRAGFTSASFDVNRDVVLVALVLFVAYGGNVLLREVLVTMRLLKVGRRAMRQHATASGTGR
jgi:hypothetical protein